MNDLTGRVALITGAAQGQGAADARLLAQLGAEVLVTDINNNEGNQLVADIRATGARASYRQLDVSQESEWIELASSLRDQGKPLHILVNNAGISFRFRLMQTEAADFDRVLAVNLSGPFHAIRHLAPIIRDSGGGSIINIGSAAGMTGHFSAAYSSSKWGLRGLTKVAALELAPWGIRVNAVHPGIVETGLVQGDDHFVAAMTRFTPLRRAAEAEDLAPVVAFLAGDGARYITGIDISVDGGMVDLGVYNAVTMEVAASKSAV